jgi:uncharacterized protein YjbI with pentapeptide repeats
MANEKHLEILRQGVKAWNLWREANSDVRPDLRKADLGIADLRKANLTGVDLESSELGSAHLDGADLSGANLRFAHLANATLTGANLVGAKMSGSLLFMARLEHANLTGARLIDANLTWANLSHATLRYAVLEGANLVGANIEDADFSDAEVYGVSAWDLKTNQGTRQENLVITKVDEPRITVDSLAVAQFVYLLLKNDNVRDVIDTIGRKAVLILGRFTEERKAVLDAIRVKLHELGFVPIMFDFEKPTQQDFTETIKTLAGLSRFIIADITNPRSSPLELQAIVPDYMTPFVPIIHEGEEPFGMFRDLAQKYGEWVIDLLQYDSVENLLANFEQAVVRPALEKAQKLQLKRAQQLQIRTLRDYS